MEVPFRESQLVFNHLIASLFQSMPSERLRNQLTMMSHALDKAILAIQPDVVKVRVCIVAWRVKSLWRCSSCNFLLFCYYFLNILVNVRLYLA